jgi:hypothetical protein
LIEPAERDVKSMSQFMARRGDMFSDDVLSGIENTAASVNTVLDANGNRHQTQK